MKLVFLNLVLISLIGPIVSSLPTQGPSSHSGAVLPEEPSSATAQDDKKDKPKQWIPNPTPGSLGLGLSEHYEKEFKELEKYLQPEGLSAVISALPSLKQFLASVDPNGNKDPSPAVLPEEPSSATAQDDKKDKPTVLPEEPSSATAQDDKKDKPTVLPEEPSSATAQDDKKDKPTKSDEELQTETRSQLARLCLNTDGIRSCLHRIKAWWKKMKN
ncbi:uncharacterized protein LOC129001587 isoform X2 [Macrosteles quadrilineatus]|uniref:uncharacterized protein LOC129001587 isoform X2 n=1 Tax=Macrosteles quadrilineatus TaxID=74068 RepID=UPI0023E18A61|nr:uncharacterized protein LOC129001587 isoform X2 [Macrosteles quadrilineatus]